MRRRCGIALGLLALIASCSNTDPSSSRSTATKGNSEFKLRMAQGVGAFRPEAIHAEEKLSLAGSGFRVASTKIDEHSGAWTWAGFDTSTGEPIPAGSDLAAIARTVVKGYQNELGFLPEEILEVKEGTQSPYPDMQLVHMRRQYNKMEIKGAFVNVFFAKQKDGTLRLREIVNNSFGPVKVNGEPGMMNDAEVADVTGVDSFKILSKKSLISPSIVDSRYEFAYATEFLLKDSENGEKVSLTVDNSSRAIHEAFSYHLREKSNFEAETYKISYILKDLIMRPLEFLTLNDGGKEISTDAQGSADVGSSNVKVILKNTKNSSAVYEYSNQKAPISFDVPLGANGKTSLKFGEGNSVGLNVYASITETIDFAEKHLKPDELKIIRNSFSAIINRNDTCNAFYDGTSLVFFKEGNGCANTALISDVVKHEWGHGLDDYLGIKSRHTRDEEMYGITDAAYSEGIGDTLASYISRSPNMGQGFRLNSSSPLRQLMHNKTYPPKNSTESESHSLGELTGGAFWRMLNNISEIYGAERGNEISARLFFRHLITSDRYLDAYEAVLRVDDDDNNAMTPSPHYCAITRAFSHHNISGGEKVGADCLDTDTSMTVKIEADQGDGKLSLLLSAGAAKIIGCSGKVSACKPSDKGYVEFVGKDGDDIETTKGNRKYYAGSAIIDARTNPIYTFFSLDSKDTPLAKRMMEFKSDSK